MAPEICIIIFGEVYFRNAISSHILNFGVIIMSLAMWHMYLVSEKISQLFLFERTHRTPLSILVYIFNLKQKKTGHQEKNRLGKH